MQEVQRLEGTHPDKEPCQSVSSFNRTGYELLVSHLFGKIEPMVADGRSGTSFANMYRQPCEFMTRQDRMLFSHIYAYAQEQGMDLKYVDALAMELGDYRQHDDGRTINSLNAGKSYDIQRRQLSVRFAEPHASTVRRITDGSAFDSTLMDKDFLRFVLEPGYQPYYNNSSLEFLEHIVMKFSAEAGKASADNRFMVYAPDWKNKDKIVTASETIKLEPIAEPHFALVNDIWTVTARGKAEGYSVDPRTGWIETGKRKPTKPVPPASPFENLIGKRPGKKNPLSLFERLYMKVKLQGRVRRP